MKTIPVEFFRKIKKRKREIWLGRCVSSSGAKIIITPADDSFNPDQNSIYFIHEPDDLYEKPFCIWNGKYIFRKAVIQVPVKEVKISTKNGVDADAIKVIEVEPGIYVPFHLLKRNKISILLRLQRDGDNMLSLIWVENEGYRKKVLRYLRKNFVEAIVRCHYGVIKVKAVKLENEIFRERIMEPFRHYFSRKNNGD